MPHSTTRRSFLRDLGLRAAAVPFILNLPSLGFANQARRKQRFVVMFSPNGVVPTKFWPDEEAPDLGEGVDGDALGLVGIVNSDSSSGWGYWLVVLYF
jgi:hypothetical protein